MQKDLYNNVKSVVAFQTGTISDGANNGVIIDTLGYEAGTIALITGTATAGDVTININESDDSGMSGATAIPSARLLNTATAVSTANSVDELGFVCTKRYIRVDFVGANSANLQATGVCNLACPHSAPVRG